MPIYQVPDWDTHFENNKSRERDRCSFVAVPNQQSGMGFTRIMAEQNGAAVFGIWILIIEVLSQQRRPRDGWLTDDGHRTGRPWAPADLALRWRRSEEEITQALEILTSANVAWLNKIEASAPLAAIEYPSTARQVPVEHPPDALEEKGKEEEGKGREEEGSRPKPRSPSPPKLCDEEYLEELQSDEAYKLLNVRHVHAKLVRWCKEKKKVPTRLRLINWLSREDQPMNGNGRDQENTSNVRGVDQKPDRAAQDRSGYVFEPAKRVG